VRKQFRRDVSEAIVKHGVEQSRMKVLEGLTRLRQICCHPALLEGTEMQASSKLDRFVEMARDLIGEGHRALVFSQFVEFLSLIERAVEREGWSYAYLDGSTNNREEVVDEFQSSEDLSLFLISLQAGGEGLNLTGADYVFLMDPWWNPAVERQAMDRTHRIGQDRPVFVYRFICPDTIEEKMLTLQENKRQMAGEVISSESGMLKEMDGDDMLELFS
jgi:non-specific serine/threonine protein kinase